MTSRAFKHNASIVPCADSAQPRSKSLTSPFDRQEIKWLFVVVGVALIVRVAAAIATQHYMVADTLEMGFETGRVAQSLAAGEGIASPLRHPSGPTAWLMPVYPAIVAGFFKLFGIYTPQAGLAIILFNCVCSSLTCIPVYHIGRSVFDCRAGWLAAWAMALFPLAVMHAAKTIWDTSFYVLLSTTLLAWLLVLPERFDLKRAAWLGLFMGGIVLVNPSIGAFYPFMLVWLYFRSSLPKPKAVLALATMTLVATATVAPWLVRNKLVLGRPYLKSNLGLELSLENNLETWRQMQRGHSGEKFRRHPASNAEEFRRYVALGETEYMAQSMDRAVHFISHHPEKFLALTMKRIVHFWLGKWGTWIGRPVEDFAQWWRMIVHVWPLPLMLAGILAAQHRREVVPLLAFLLLYPLIYYVTHASEAYRHPIEPIVLVFAGGAISTAVARLRCLHLLSHPLPWSRVHA